MRVLYVEDEKYLADAVVHNLKKSGISVDHAASGTEGLDLAVKPVYDCLILDIMLPGISGLEILETIRRKGVRTPVIMLSALDQTEDKVAGLDLGADDYLAKPFKTAELVARINALVRRPPLVEKQNLTFADITLDLANHTLNGITLTEKEFGIMEVLMKNPDTALKKEFILNRIWGVDAYAQDNYVEVYVSYIRKKLKELGAHCEVKTLRGLGYKLVEKKDV